VRTVRWKNVTSIQVRSSQGRYAVHIGAGLLRQVGTHRVVAGRECFVVTTPAVFGLWGEGLLRGFARKQRPRVLFAPEGERAKQLRVVEQMARELASAGARRDSLLLVFGGGAVGDSAGLLASLYQRGIDLVQVPTTLLAQVDASIGGKTAVNLPEGKNLLGTFHAPRAVFADTTTLATLPPRQFRAGLFECIKCGLIGDARLVRLLENNRAAILARKPEALLPVIAAAIRVKARLVARDEHDHGPRMLLNFGHTFAHGFESVLGYRTLLHGEAVAWGMLAALNLSEAIGCLDSQAAHNAAQLVRAYGPLPPFHADARSVLAAMARDKKNRAQGRRYVLCSGIGEGFVAAGIPDRDVSRVLGRILAEARA
jgi:3-dehydroquinate synthase